MTTFTARCEPQWEGQASACRGVTLAETLHA